MATKHGFFGSLHRPGFPIAALSEGGSTPATTPEKEILSRSAAVIVARSGAEIVGRSA